MLTVGFYSISIPILEVNGEVWQHFSGYHLLYWTEVRNLYRFGTRVLWVNDDRIFILEVNYSSKFEFYTYKILSHRNSHIFLNSRQFPEVYWEPAAQLLPPYWCDCTDTEEKQRLKNSDPHWFHSNSSDKDCHYRMKANGYISIKYYRNKVFFITMDSLAQMNCSLSWTKNVL